MELHKFGIGNRGARAGRHAEAFTARFQRIGGDGIERTEAAGGKNHRRGAEQHQAGVWAHAVTCEQPDDAAIFTRQFEGVIPLQHCDGRIGERAFGQGAADLRPGTIALHMHDAMGGMGCLPPLRQ